MSPHPHRQVPSAAAFAGLSPAAVRGLGRHDPLARPGPADRPTARADRAVMRCCRVPQITIAARYCCCCKRRPGGYRRIGILGKARKRQHLFVRTQGVPVYHSPVLVPFYRIYFFGFPFLRSLENGLATVMRYTVYVNYVHFLVLLFQLKSRASRVEFSEPHSLISHIVSLYLTPTVS